MLADQPEKPDSEYETVIGRPASHFVGQMLIW